MFAMNPWDGIIPQSEQEAYRAAGFGRRSGLGQRPALAIIDVQYRTVGTQPRPFMEAIKEFPTAGGQGGWDAVPQIARVLALFPVARRGYDFVPEVAPEANDVLLPKKHPSAFFGTPLASYLIERGVDTLVVTGCTTSGCVRGTVVDGFAYNFRILVPHECVYDRSQVSHAVNLFDMSEKYADVMSADAALTALQSLARAAA